MIRKFKTAADFLAMAACPLLIMGLLWALLFFLLNVFYGGEWKGALQWTLFWFALAITLVSRIAIERTPGAAGIYGAILAGVTSLIILQYVGGRWSVFLFLAILWWAAHKLTFDCTLIEDEDKTSGQGLLQAGRVDLRQRKSSSLVRPANRLPRAPPEPKKNKIQDKKTTREDQIHSPGVWVLYFALAAVPLFGLGGVLLASPAEKQRAFYLLAQYLACAAGLLLLTSFLGLRRYLRQRYLEMPARMAVSWITRGIGIIVIVFVAAFLLPRPSTPYSLGNFITKLTSPEQDAGDLGNALDKAAESASKAESRPQPGGGEPAKGPQPTPSASGTGDAVSRIPQAAAKLDRVISWIVLLLITVLLFWRFRKEMSEWMSALWASLRALWGGKAQARAAKPGQPRATQKSLILRNPFLARQRSDPATLVRETYHSLRLWAEHRGFGAPEHETPLEFSERLAQFHPGIRNDLLKLARHYSHLAYASEPPPEDSIKSLQSIWFVMTGALALRK